MTRVRGLLIFLAVFAAAGCEYIPQSEPTPVFVIPGTPTPEPGALYTVAKGSIAETLKARGRVIASQEASLYFEDSGWLKSLKVAVGEQVNRGALVAELEKPEIEFDLEDARNELELAKLAKAELSLDLEDAQYELELAKLDVSIVNTELEALDAEIENAKVNIARRKTLRDRAYDNYQEIAYLVKDPEVLRRAIMLEDAESALRSATLSQQTLEIEKKRTLLGKSVKEQKVNRAQLKVNMVSAKMKKDTVKQAQLKVDRISARIQKTRLQAPFSGTIIAVDSTPGSPVQPFEPVAVIADPSLLRVEVNVAQEDIERVYVGLAAVVTLDAYPQKPLPTKVSQIAAKPTTFQGQSVYKVTMDFTEKDKAPAAVRMGGDVLFNLKIKRDVLLVPSRAILASGQQQYVEAVAGGKIDRIQVKAGVTDGNQTEVLSGLREGQVIRIP
ncbi:MAG: HlyD family efflux transporter periplasmic adaptor subunit [Chloroflexi bacterium]|nr:HlyD family efflux transporter periplasmic adaptor subunit [Chloroflexota bacterium]